MTQKIKYFTTPLYYVNAEPHIGHAYTNIITDSYARFYRDRGETVFFLTGTDEHGTKIEKTAKQAGKSAKEFVDDIVPHFKDLWSTLDIQYDDFIRTTEDRHKKVVAKVLTDLEAKGDIYKASYKGWYCTPCESFWTDLQLKEEKCPDCSREVQELEEENYFFKLSKYQEWLIEYIHGNEGFVFPEMRKNEILGFLKNPLEDLCITRPKARLQWGIPYPNSEEHVVYVWFDALLNYISAIGYGSDDGFKDKWPAAIQFVGKDILRQHVVFWPIMLKAIGLELPRTVVAHGWWTMAGTKVSKSRGNAVDPKELVSTYGVDAFRYFMLREVTLGFDGAFSEDLLRERYTTDLANDLGNLWFRFASMLGKYFESKAVEVPLDILEQPLLAETIALYEKSYELMQNHDPRETLNLIFKQVTKANQYVEENKPWVLAKDPDKRTELARVIATLGEFLARVAILLKAFMPETAKKILERLSLAESHDLTERFSRALLLFPGTEIQRGEPLFPKLEDLEENKV